MNIARTTLITSLIAFSSVAQAAQHEASFELGSLATPDPTWDLFSYGMASSTIGVRLGYGIDDRITILGSWHHDAQGGHAAHDFEYDDWNDDSGFGLAFYGNTFAVGPKVRHAVKPWLAPYATAQLMVLHGQIKLDDVTGEDDNANQLRYTSMAPGGMLTAGVDFMPFEVRHGAARLASHLELGYGYVRPLEFSDDSGDDNSKTATSLGDLSFNGFAVRWGIGVRF